MDDNRSTNNNNTGLLFEEKIKKEEISKEHFVIHFDEYLPKFISDGNPSKDTLVTYTSNIRQFITWCNQGNYNPLQLGEGKLRKYLFELQCKGYKVATIKLKVSAIKSFYFVARKMNVISYNPFAEILIELPNEKQEESVLFSMEEIQKICAAYDNVKDEFTRNRNKLILYFMSVEGLTIAEVQAIDIEDINWDEITISIKGKKEQRRIFPCKSTMKVLIQYLSCLDVYRISTGALFLSNSRKNMLDRISKNGIRYIVDTALISCNLKIPRVSCHTLRNSCGYNLIQNDNDTKLVQNIMGYKHSAMIAKFEKMVNEIENRATESLVKKGVVSMINVSVFKFDLFELLTMESYLIHSEERDNGEQILHVFVDMSPIQDEHPNAYQDDPDMYKFLIRMEGKNGMLRRFNLHEGKNFLREYAYNTLPKLLESVSTWQQFMKIVWDQALSEKEELNPEGYKNILYAKNNVHMHGYWK